MSEAQYRVTKESYIDDQIVKADTIVTYSGWPGSNLEPVNPEAERVAERYAELKAAAKDDPKATVPKSPAEDGKPKAGKKPAAADDGGDKSDKSKPKAGK